MLPYIKREDSIYRVHILSVLTYTSVLGWGLLPALIKFLVPNMMSHAKNGSSPMDSMVPIDE